MRSLDTLLASDKKLRAIGFDDAPFQRGLHSTVAVAGVVCSDTRFEGMLWGQVEQDGLDATDQLCRLLTASKFYQQVNLVLTDGIALAGFNIIDLPRLAQQLNRPCIAVMRRPPNVAAVDRALRTFVDYLQRRQLLERAGPVHSQRGFVYQQSGCTPESAALALARLTDTGKVPEALRLAHLIGAAVVTGQSSKRA
ncbi:endonuclease dU [Marinobacterium arenosum]|uniref:endonuclease dU n=1 Tax=Marinobacterium arenosum TaxID=2862496 RepID=UPI001C97CC31|nr:DUF99 family protein [Marinobacterium arenosum]MBY4678192.1 DUF99 family protein [Marinobacterium arenosum]